MKKILFFVLGLFIGSTVFAETINLKDGRTVTGRIDKRDLNEIKINVKGIPMTVYWDEIKDIDGVPVAGTAPSPKSVSDAKASLGSVLQPASQKKELILQFIDVFGTRQAMTQNLNTMIESTSLQRPELAKQIREKFKIDEIIERLVPLYDKYFTEEELKVYIKFYSSEEGKKLITNIGAVLKDSIEVGAKYMKEKFPEVK